MIAHWDGEGVEHLAVLDGQRGPAARQKAVPLVMLVRSSGTLSSTVDGQDLRQLLQAVGQHRLHLVERRERRTKPRGDFLQEAGTGRGRGLPLLRLDPLGDVADAADGPGGVARWSLVTLPCASIQRSVPSGHRIRFRSTYVERASPAAWTAASTSSRSSGRTVSSHAS